MNMKKEVEIIVVSYGINCFVSRRLIYNYPESLFTNADVVSIEHADFDGIERLHFRPDLVTLDWTNVI